MPGTIETQQAQAQEADATKAQSTDTKKEDHTGSKATVQSSPSKPNGGNVSDSDSDSLVE